jgi:hypothetical protein
MICASRTTASKADPMAERMSLVKNVLDMFDES